MSTIAIIKKIIKLGGTITSITGTEITVELNNQDISYNVGSHYFTARAISKRDYCDVGSDYNPGGYEFYRKVKNLELLVSNN